MKDNKKKSIISLIGAIVVSVIILGPLHAAAEEQGTSPGKLVVGAMNVPPFLIKGEGGNWEGLSIELLQAVARELDMEFELREYSNAESILDDAQTGEIDLIPILPITETHEVILDFSHQYFRSGLAIAVSKTTSTPRLLRFARQLVSTDILVVVGGLLLLSLIAGVIVWLFEGRQNREFDGGLVKGAGHGLWWAVVTMTTVGYGDKAPRTVGGRMTALIWMFTSIVLIASFTAAITTTLTVSELGGKIQGLQDLPGARVGAFAGSEGQAFLQENGIDTQPYENLRDALTALSEKNIDAFVFNEAVLKYTVKKEFPGNLAVLPDVFNQYYLGMAMPTKSPLNEDINRALLRIIIKDEWRRSVERYFGHHR